MTRSVFVQVRLSSEEKALWVEAAEGAEISDFLRRLVREHWEAVRAQRGEVETARLARETVVRAATPLKRQVGCRCGKPSGQWCKACNAVAA